MFVRECADGERLVVGCYVDNFQICHSVQLDGDGRGPEGCAYNTFLDALRRDWEVVDGCGVTHHGSNHGFSVFSHDPRRFVL